MVTVGLELHNCYFTACALNDASTVLAEHHRRFNLDSRLPWKHC